MAVIVERMPGEPIVIATYNGVVTKQDALDMYRQSVELTPDVDGRLYRISDVREATSTFVEIFSIIREVAKDIPGATNDPRITVVFVGKNHWVKMLQDAIKQPAFGGIQIPSFTTMEDAMHFIRLHQQKSTQT